MYKIVIKKVLPLFYCVVLAFLTLWLFSIATSPRYGIIHYGDPAIFQIIGKGWAEGHLPYVELWDLKGPIVFLINAVGYWLTDTSGGVFLIQWLCFSLTLLVCYRLLRTQFSMGWSMALLLLLSFSFSYSVEQGNSVSEYILPLVSLSYYCVYKWLYNVERKGTGEHSAIYAVVYGATLGWALMSRLTDAVGVCVVVAVIAVWLVVKKSWKNLLWNIFAFLVGFAVIVLPFVIYFAAHGALYDMWYGTILYNLDYAGDSGSSNSLWVRLIFFRDAWLMLAVAVLALVYNIHLNKNVLCPTTWLLVAAFSLVWYYRGFGFAHYALVSLPLIAVSLVLAKQTFGGSTLKVRALPIMIIVLFTLFTFRLSFITLRGTDNGIKANNKAIARIEQFMQGTPQSVCQSFVAYNTTPAYYLTANIFPADRFFTYQDWNASRSPSLQRYMREDFAKKRIRWILVDGGAVQIGDLLKRQYHVYKTDGKGLTLYERNK